jgi:hypothetical protein
MSKRWRGWIVVVACVVGAAWSRGADAGSKLSFPVAFGSNYAYGAIGSARASTDSVQYIGCSSYGTSGACVAQDATGSNWKMCAWSSAAAAAAVHSIGPHSYIVFYWDTSGNCTNVYVSNYSYQLPATP